MDYDEIYEAAFNDELEKTAGIKGVGKEILKALHIGKKPVSRGEAILNAVKGAPGAVADTSKEQLSNLVDLIKSHPKASIGTGAGLGTLGLGGAGYYGYNKMNQQ